MRASGGWASGISSLESAAVALGAAGGTPLPSHTMRYRADSLRRPPTAKYRAPSCGRTTMSVTPSGSIVSLALLSFGTGYTVAPTVTVADPLFTITGPTNTGFFVVPAFAVGQVGELTGMTLRTACNDMALISAMLGEEIVGYRG